MFSKTSFDVIYEDSYILVINKPSGVVVNVSESSKTDTIQNILIEEKEDYFEESDEKSEFVSRSGLVHRLDKNTSGVLLIAKTEEMFKKLQRQFKKREVTKEYITVVQGNITDAYFEIDAPIKRNPKLRTRMAICADGKEALTKFLLLDTLEINGLRVSILKVLPLTGRTHQIRVHLAAFGHPVMSDDIYMGRKAFQESLLTFPRLMLHARKLKIMHPYQNKEMSFEAEIPEEFLKISSKYA